VVRRRSLARPLPARFERLLRPPSLPFWRGLWRRWRSTSASGCCLLSCLLLVLQRPLLCRQRAACRPALSGAGQQRQIPFACANPSFSRISSISATPSSIPVFTCRFSAPAGRRWRCLPLAGAMRAAGGICCGSRCSVPADFLTGRGNADACSGCCCSGWGRGKDFRVTFDAAADLRQLGLLAALWRYGEEELIDLPLLRPMRGSLSRPAVTGAMAASGGRAERVLLRSCGGCTRASAARSCASSTICRQAHLARATGGSLPGVPIPYAPSLLSLGPRRRVARGAPLQPLSSAGAAGGGDAGQLPAAVAATGPSAYTPTRQASIRRHKVFPRNWASMSSSTCAALPGRRRSGPYISDLASPRSVCSLLGEAARAAAVRLSSSPWRTTGPCIWKRFAPDDAERFYSTPPPAGCDDLTVYLRHLVNADRMAGRLRAALEALPGAGTLCWFGDHVPIMPEVYRRLGRARRADRLLHLAKGRGGRCGRSSRSRGSNELGSLLLQEMGLSLPTSPP
jgi:hypothetical protein